MKIRAETLRTYLAVHTWTGIVAGLALFIAFYAGALTMFKAPLLEWVTPPPDGARGGAIASSRVAATADSADSADSAIDEAARLLERAWAERPATRAEVTLHLGNATAPARIQWGARRDQGGHWATLGADGTLVEAPHQVSGLADFIDEVHRTAGLPVDTELGAAIMGGVSALYALALVSGVIVLLPTLVRDFFALRLGRNLKRLWLDAHNVIGIASLPFHLVMALSAVVFGLHDVIYDVQDRTVYEGRLAENWQASGVFAPAVPDPAPADPLPLDALLARLDTIAPRLVPHVLQFRRVGTAGAAVLIRGEEPCCLQRAPFGSLVVLGAVDGRLLNGEYLPGHQSVWAASISSFFSLHFGNFGGAPIRWSYFFLGLAGAFLFYSGNLIWIETRRRRARRGDADTPVQRRATRLMASATVGSCLGCIAGLSLAIVSGKVLHGHVADLDAWQRAAYYLAFVPAVAWAFIRGAPRSAVDLLALAAVATVLIPLSSLAGWLLPSTGWWAHGGAALGVDLVALAGAVALFLMMRATRERLRRGVVDSVWSARGPKTASA